MDSVAGYVHDVEQAGRMLTDPDPSWTEVARLLSETARWLGALTPSEEADVEPFLLMSALEAAASAWASLVDEDRRGARLAVERLRQTLRDIAAADQVGPTADRLEVAGWVARQLPDVPPRVLAELSDVSERTWQRWQAGQAEPSATQAQRVRVVAQALSHLRHSYTPAGCVEWFLRPHPGLGQERPLDVLADPMRARDVIDVAAGSRVTVAT